MTCCIYCLEDRPNDLFRNAEHVVPQSFGKFKNNFTLREVVCDECNQYFGDHLEIALARDTIEGHSRFDFGVKDAAEARPFGRGGVVIKIAEGAYAGAYAYREYSADADRILLKLPPQVGFRMLTSQKYEYYLLDEIPTKDELDAKGFDAGHRQSIRGIEIDQVSLQKRLADKGFSFNFKGSDSERSGSLLCELEATIDHTIFRALTKIAFNYLAYFQCREFLLETAFDAARRYVRYGDKPRYAMVQMKDEAILGDEPVEGERRLAHLITTDWAADGVSVLAQVSLFNRMTYCISLLRDYRGERRNIKRGHLFNVSNGEILELEAR